MSDFSRIRKKTQITSFAVSSIIFAVALYGILTGNHNYFEIGLLLIGFMIVAAVLLSPLLGRFWCGWLCPRGTVLEYFIGKFSRKKRIPENLRTKGFKLFIATIMAGMFIIVLMGMNPFVASEDMLASIGGFIVFLCIVTSILVAFPLGLVYMPRTWCGFCPMGYAQSLLSKNRILKISIEGCKNCKRCHAGCQLDLCSSYTGKSRTIEHPDCFSCMKCTDSCRIGVNRPVISPGTE